MVTTKEVERPQVVVIQLQVFGGLLTLEVSSWYSIDT